MLCIQLKIISHFWDIQFTGLNHRDQYDVVNHPVSSIKFWPVWCYENHFNFDQYDVLTSMMFWPVWCFDQYDVVNHPVVGTEPTSSSHYEGTTCQPHLSWEDDDCATMLSMILMMIVVRTITAKGPSPSYWRGTLRWRQSLPALIRPKQPTIWTTSHIINVIGLLVKSTLRSQRWCW